MFPLTEDVIKQDTISNPPDYKNKYVITNPPYLSRNKSKNKTLYDLYNVNDLYKCFLMTILYSNNLPEGGILILPVNFFCSNRKADINLRKEFLTTFKILKVNLFENQIFDDTSSAVCSFQFIRMNSKNDTFEFNIISNEKVNKLNITLTNFCIGGELFSLPKSKYFITRYTKKYENNPTNIFIKCIDDSVLINASFKPPFKDETEKLSERSFCTLCITPPINEDKQKELISEFNIFLNDKRKEYNSLFLSSYREGTRKRIGFDMVYDIFSYLLSKYDTLKINGWSIANYQY